MGFTTGRDESWKRGVEERDIGGREGMEKEGMPEKDRGGEEACEVSHRSEEPAS